MLCNISNLKGKPIVTAGFFDSSHAICLFTQKSKICMRSFANKKPITSYSKRKNCVEKSTYGSELVDGKISMDKAVKFRCNFRILGAPVKGPIILFGDNRSVIKNTSLLHSILKKSN